MEPGFSYYYLLSFFRKKSSKKRKTTTAGKGKSNCPVCRTDIEQMVPVKVCDIEGEFL